MNIRTFALLVGTAGALAIASLGSGCKTTATSSGTGGGLGCTVDADCTFVCGNGQEEVGVCTDGVCNDDPALCGGGTGGGGGAGGASCDPTLKCGVAITDCMGTICSDSTSAPLFEALKTCGTTKCSTECPGYLAEDMCMPMMTCSDCITANCKAESDACSSDI